MGYKKEHKCERCGKKVIARTSRQKFCKDCYKENYREWKRNWLRKNKSNLLKHREGLKQARKKYPETKRANQKRYSKKHKQEVIAQRMAQVIPLKDQCEICNSKENLERHHWNYEKPLMVNTLCKQCHTIQHNKNLIEVQQ